MDGRRSVIPPRFPYPPPIRPQIPLGLEALYGACRRLYPNQPNPLQVTAVVKYWLGGPDPLDYISMYSYPGDPARDIDPHWHYISFGLSDLHGDARVHDISGRDSPSGFGFELTFRLKKEPDETSPPTWPAAIMQALAKYVFQSENTLCSGDHVSWHCSLDNSESRIQHMLMYEDPQLGTVCTPFGPVTFIQIVGVCSEELQAAQRWNGPSIIQLMKSVKGAGGPWLVTDMRRGESMFELDPNVQEAVDRGIETEGSNLSGVSAKCYWQQNAPWVEGTDNIENQNPESESPLPQISVLESEQIKEALKKGLQGKVSGPPSVKPKTQQTCIQSKIDENKFRKDNFGSNANSDVPALETVELLQKRVLESVHLRFNLESGMLLPLALRGRLKHGKHFTFKSIVDDTAVTFVPLSVVGAFVDEEHPYATHGPWLQVLITEDLIETMLNDLSVLSQPDHLNLPVTFSWPEKQISITLIQEDC